MTLPIFIAGLILRLTSGWFAGQHTVGDICLWVGGIGIVLQIVIFFFIGALAVGGSRRRRR